MNSLFPTNTPRTTASVTSLDLRASSGTVSDTSKRATTNKSSGTKVTEMPARSDSRRRSFAEIDGKHVTWIVTDDLSGIDDLPYAVRTSSVIVMKSVSEVIESCRVDRIRPSLVVADLDMRPTSGLILAALIRNHFPECKLWLLSEHADGIRHALCRSSKLANARIVRKPLCFRQMHQAEISPIQPHIKKQSAPLAETSSESLCRF